MDVELTEENQTAASVVSLVAGRGPVWPNRSAIPGSISFDRQELRDIFDLYGRKVADGEWRDYAIAATGQKAVFSIYRRSAEFPLYRIEKIRGARKQGAYCVVAATGLILRRGHDLKRVINVLDKKLTIVSG
ncbi:MAG TPA: DUF2794 domain-containing protein [Roseiarcus sp.]|nr:DUF2794 domain-containing protein [Roseiarcus sp.]